MHHGLNSMWHGTVAEQSYVAISVGVPDSILRQSAMAQSDYPDPSFPPRCTIAHATPACACT